MCFLSCHRSFTLLYIYVVYLLLQGGPYHDLLHSLLGAYACYRPDVGYVSIHLVLVKLKTRNLNEKKLTKKNASFQKVKKSNAVLVASVMTISDLLFQTLHRYSYYVQRQRTLICVSSKGLLVTSLV